MDSTDNLIRRGVTLSTHLVGLDREFVAGNGTQDDGNTLTAFVGPFMDGTQGRQEEAGALVDSPQSATQRGPDEVLVGVGPPEAETRHGQDVGRKRRRGYKGRAKAQTNRRPQGGTLPHTRAVGREATNQELVRLCLWGENGRTPVMWERLRYLCRASTTIKQVQKIARVKRSPTSPVRFDIWVTQAFATRLIEQMRPGRDRYGWTFRQHIPNPERGPAPQRATTTAPMVVPTPNTPPGPSLVVGTLNINGLLGSRDRPKKKKKTLCGDMVRNPITSGFSMHSPSRNTGTCHKIQ